MTKKEVKKLTPMEEMVLTDMAAFIQWSIKNFSEHSLSFESILANLNHDIRGIAADDPYFLPRTRGYYQRIK